MQSVRVFSNTFEKWASARHHRQPSTRTTKLGEEGGQTIFSTSGEE